MSLALSDLLICRPFGHASCLVRVIFIAARCNSCTLRVNLKPLLVKVISIFMVIFDLRNLIQTALSCFLCFLHISYLRLLTFFDVKLSGVVFFTLSTPRKIPDVQLIYGRSQHNLKLTLMSCKRHSFS